jgi:hypothetical protein
MLLKFIKIYLAYLSSGKERIHIRRDKIHLKEGTKKTLDGGKLSELETIRTQLTNIKPIVN